MDYKKHASIRIPNTIIFLIVILIGCSSGGYKSNPVIPEDEVSSSDFTDSEVREGSVSGGHVLLGYSMIYFDATDPENVKIEMVPARLGEIHLNILSLLETGMCNDCYQILDIASSTPNVFDVQIRITHPIEDENFKLYTLFDVRGIMNFDGNREFTASGLTLSDKNLGDCELINSEGLTNLYNGSTIGQAEDLFTYYQGNFTTPDVPNADLNGYLRHISADPGNNRNALYTGDYSDRTYSIILPGGKFSFGYAVDASWDIPTMPITDPLTDFPITANCDEPWKITASSAGIIGNEATTLIIDVFDWSGQDSYFAPVIECTELFEGQVTSTFKEEGNGFSRFEAEIYNSNGAAAGIYGVLISVEAKGNSTSPAWLNLTSFFQTTLSVYTALNSGNLLWAKRAGKKSYNSTGSVECYDITTLSDDSIVVTGYSSGSTIFGEGEPNETVLTDGVYENTNIFIARYYTDGTLAWVKLAAGNNVSKSYGITSLSDNSIVVTGYFRETMTFGEGELFETDLISAGAEDIFIARYDRDGYLEWAKRAGGDHDGIIYTYSTACDIGYGITTLSDDSIVVTGRILGDVIFGEDEPNETVIAGSYPHQTRIFVARYNPDGSLEWVKHTEGGTNGETLTALSDDSTVIIGWFRGGCYFGQGEPNEVYLESIWGEDIFLARYNPDGTLGWVKQVEGTSYYDDAYDICTLTDDSIVMTGEFTETATFGVGEPNETILDTSNSYSDMFVSRYNADGSLMWAKQEGGSYPWSNQTGHGISSLADDSIIVTGYFSSESTFGEGTANETSLESNGYTDIFISHFNSDGSFDWVKQSGSQNTDHGLEISLLSDDSFVIAGDFKYHVTFGEGEPNETELTSPFTDWYGHPSLFIARYVP